MTELSSKIQQQIQDVNDKLATLTEKTDNHGEYITDHRARIRSLEAELKKVQDDIDEQVNRNLRNNIVIKNMPGDEKTWEETKTVVAQLLAELDGRTDGENYLSLIERAHRHGKIDQAAEGENTTKSILYITQKMSNTSLKKPDWSELRINDIQLM